MVMSKVQAIQDYLKEQQIDAVFLTTPDNIFYVSGFKSNPYERLLGVLIFKDASPFLICPQMEVPDAQACDWPFEIVGHTDTQNPWEVLASTVKKRAIKLNTIAIEKTHLTVERLEALQAFFPQVSFKRFDDQMNNMRVIKSEEEIANLRIAAELADYAIEVGCREMAEGKTEMEILTAIENAIKEKGCTMAFETMVLTGAKTASPHGTPGNRKLQKGDMVLFDLGVQYNGYCSDITRTIAFGEPSEAQKEIYHAVRQANENAIASVKPGVSAMELDKIARDTITEAGYGPYFNHRLGHGLGISVHEFPSITGTNEMILTEGMVFTIEPGIYKADVTGVRIEDDVIVTNDGVEVLTKFTKELVIIKP